MVMWALPRSTTTTRSTDFIFEWFSQTNYSQLLSPAAQHIVSVEALANYRQHRQYMMTYQANGVQHCQGEPSGGKLETVLRQRWQIQTASSCETSFPLLSSTFSSRISYIEDVSSGLTRNLSNFLHNNAINLGSICCLEAQNLPTKLYANHQ